MLYKIMIIDSNEYFKAGLKAIIRNYFLKTRHDVMFIKMENAHPLADIIFWAPNVSWDEIPIDLAYDKRIILIGNKQKHGYFRGKVYRDAPCSVLHDILFNIIRMRICSLHREFVSDKLSIQQNLVLYYLSLGEKPLDIANYMNISEKTVSQHKRKAMTVLKLCKNTDLNQWLLARLAYCNEHHIDFSNY